MLRWLLVVCLSHQVAGQSTYDKAALHQLTQFRQQHRKADGQLCAGAFIQNMKAYTDCTDDPDPDGGTGREWCYLESQISKANPQKRWGYCSPVIDYNLIRAKTNEALQAKANEAEIMIERLDQETNRLTDVFDRYKETCAKDQYEIETKLTRIESLLSKGERCITKIGETTAKIRVLQQTVAQIEDKLKKQRAKALSAPENCASMPGYEDEGFPDGLRAAFYDNPVFKGPPVYRQDDRIDFRWNGKDPVPSVSHKSFSVRWEGYIQAPHSMDYTFVLETDCGGRVFLNNKPLIVDRMPHPTASEIEIPVLPPTIYNGIRETSSAPVALSAGEKNHIKIEMIHSNHLKWDNPDDAMIRLSWSTAGSPPTVIPSEAFFQANHKPPLKISGLAPHAFELSFLYDGVYAYKGDSSHFIADVPPNFHGSKLIITDPSLNLNQMTFSVNVPCRVFVAYPMGMVSPIACRDRSFHPTSEVISVYEAENRDAVASKIQYMTIEEMTVPDGETTLQLDILTPGVQFFVFLIQVKGAAQLCGGPTMLLSAPTSPVYEMCESSSQESDKFDCTSGLNGRRVDQPYGTWRTAAQNGIGEYLIVRFKSLVRLTEMRFKPLDDPVNWPSELVLHTSESSLDESAPQSFTVVHSGNLDELRYPIKPVITRFLRIEITGLFVNGEGSGGSFEFYGTACQPEENTPTLASAPSSPSSQFISEQPEIFHVQDCRETLLDFTESFSLGAMYQVVCPSYCIDRLMTKVKTMLSSSSSTLSTSAHQAPIQPHQFLPIQAASNPSPSIDIDVYGSTQYALESSLCLMGLHTGVCSKSPSSEKPCRMTVSLDVGKQAYTGSMKNGVISQPHGPSDFSLECSRSIYESDINDDAEQKNTTVAISFRGPHLPAPPPGYLIDDGSPYSSKSGGLMYGWSQRISPDHCSEDVGYTETMNVLNLGGITFPSNPESPQCLTGLKEDCTSGAQWSIELPQKGIYRLEVQVGNLCEPTEGTRKYFLQANQIPIIAGQDLKKGQYYWATQNLNLSNKTLTLTSECELNGAFDAAYCKTSRTTLMNLKLTQLPSEPHVI